MRNDLLLRDFLAGSSAFFGAGLGGGAPPFAAKNDRMSGISRLDVRMRVAGRRIHDIAQPALGRIEVNSSREKKKKKQKKKKPKQKNKKKNKKKKKKKKKQKKKNAVEA